MLPRPSFSYSGSYQHFREGLLRGNGFHKFLWIYLLVSVKIDSSNDCKVVLFCGLAKLGIEVPLQILLVDKVETAVINCLEGCLSCIAFA